jgi:hypothetical protein
MAGLGPAIHGLSHGKEDVDGRHKAGHDVVRGCLRFAECALQKNFQTAVGW